MRKLLVILFLFLSINFSNAISIFIYPSNQIFKKGETIGLIIFEDETNKVQSISIEDKIFPKMYEVSNGVYYSLLPIPHTVLTNFYLKILTFSGNFSNTIQIPFEVNIDPLLYAKRKPKVIKSFEVSNDFSFKTNKFNKFFDEDFTNVISVFIKPVEGEIKDGYGVNRSRGGIVYGRIHLGIDIPKNRGEKVFSTFNGIVVESSRDRKAGKYVVVYHGFGLSSVYMHLSEILVKKGQIVNTNDIIGLVGSTGRSTGPHLHFGISIDGIYVDPTSFFERDYSFNSIISNGVRFEF
ncbi:MAG: M23 family metallopeptidase [Brevinematia bacterium]